MTKTLERRYWTQPVEVRAGTGSGDVIAGYAAVFNRYSQNLGGYVEQIDPVCFDRDLDGTDILCLFNHDMDDVLGRTGVNLEVEVDGTGLAYRCATFADDVAAQSVVAKVRNRLVTQSSFGFYCLEDDWSLTDQGFPLRTVLRAVLVDVSPVTRPAYVDTTTGLRSLSEKRGLDLAAVVAAAERNALKELLGEESRQAEAPAAPGPTPVLLSRRRAQ
jgi:HK97 family phage prohead protease